MFDNYLFKKRYLATFKAIELDENARDLLDQLEKSAIGYVDRVLDLEIYKETHKEEGYDKDELAHLDNARKISHNSLISMAQAFARYVKKNKDRFPNYPKHDLFYGYSLNDRYSLGDWAFEFVKSFHPKILKNRNYF